MNHKSSKVPITKFRLADRARPVKPPVVSALDQVVRGGWPNRCPISDQRMYGMSL